MDIVRKVLHSGVDVNAKDNIGETALIHATKNGQVEIVEKLLNMGADVNVSVATFPGMEWMLLPMLFIIIT